MPAAILLDRPQITALDEGLSPVFGFRQECTMLDFPDRMAAVFFTTGCNFRCGYCHNFAQLGVRRPGFTWEKVRETVRKLKDRWIDGAVISGGEPTMHESLPRLVDLFRRENLDVKLDTNGTNPDMLAELLPRLAYVAMDIKCGPDAYPSQVGYRHMERVRRSVELLKTSGVPYAFRTTVVPTVHTDEEMHRIAEFIDGAERYVLQPFLPQDDLPDVALRSQPRTPPQAIRRAGDIVRPHVRHLELRGA